MSANRDGGQGAQKSGQKPVPENEEDSRKPGQQQNEPGQVRQQQQDRPVGGRENR
jgi:hypothetical protein